MIGGPGETASFTLLRYMGLGDRGNMNQHKVSAHRMTVQHIRLFVRVTALVVYLMNVMLSVIRDSVPSHHLMTSIHGRRSYQQSRGVG